MHNNNVLFFYNVQYIWSIQHNVNFTTYKLTIHILFHSIICVVCICLLIDMAAALME